MKSKKSKGSENLPYKKGSKMNIQEILNNVKNTHYTTSEIKEKYGISPGTIRTYIMRDKVIPEDKRIKIGRQWFIEKEFAEEKWGLKMKNTTVYKIYEDAELVKEIEEKGRE